MPCTVFVTNAKIIITLHNITATVCIRHFSNNLQSPQPKPGVTFIEKVTFAKFKSEKKH